MNVGTALFYAYDNVMKGKPICSVISMGILNHRHEYLVLTRESSKRSSPNISPS